MLRPSQCNRMKEARITTRIVVIKRALNNID
jgi:hypothetical protein